MSIYEIFAAYAPTLTEEGGPVSGEFTDAVAGSCFEERAIARCLCQSEQRP
jgi:hypothetical protein